MPNVHNSIGMYENIFQMIINVCHVNEVCFFLFGILEASQVCKIQAKFAEKSRRWQQNNPINEFLSHC